jgi:hypothetical protein
MPLLYGMDYRLFHQENVVGTSRVGQNTERAPALDGSKYWSWCLLKMSSSLKEISSASTTCIGASLVVALEFRHRHSSDDWPTTINQHSCGACITTKACTRGRRNGILLRTRMTCICASEGSKAVVHHIEFILKSTSYWQNVIFTLNIPSMHLIDHRIYLHYSTG